MRIAALLVTLMLPAIAHAELVDIKWTGGTFSHKAGIAPRKFLEVCGKIEKNSSVAWQFNANAPTDFNIHFHVGDKVTYPENRKNIAVANGTLAVPQAQDYCWMWNNYSAQPITLELDLKQGQGQP